ncbi:MAG: hypothetical protein BWK73_46715 [Thiothrix lacustris]|uniref:Helix-hairpin-helix domain-containing protein n=1 Tax=Thiothrix lacustris TaxID=525917 RepID=A0A1Y1QAI0_9GAMM|nr:MAG: hypothetical protein BWK73_46715 [Thiothrix lacustris]
MEQDLANVKYVGPATIKRLAEHGVTTIAQLAGMSVDALAALPGIGDNTAPLIIASAQELLAVPPAEEAEIAAVETEVVDELAEEIPAEYIVVVAEPELSKKDLKKAAKKAKKAVKKALKKAEKLEKETKKAARKAEKKVKKAEKKAKKTQKKD